MKFNFSFLVALLLTASLFAQPDGIDFQDLTWKQALERAEAEDKLIFVDAYTTWCGPCKMMDKNTFTDDAVAAFFNETFIPVKFDMEKGEGITLAVNYNVRGYPNFLFVDGAGKLVHRGIGYQAPADFLELGRAAGDRENNLEGMRKRFAKGERSPEFLFLYTNAAAAAMDGSHVPAAEAYLATQDDLSDRQNLEFIYRFTETTDGMLFDHFLAQRENMTREFGERAVNQKVEMMVQQALYAEDPPTDAEVKAIYEKVNPQRAEELYQKFQLNKLRRNNDFSAYADAAWKYYKGNDAANADELNDVAWTIYEGSDSKKALKRGLKLGLASTKAELSYFNADTVAALYHKLGKNKKAEMWALKAIDLAKADGMDPSDTEKLLERIRA